MASLISHPAFPVAFAASKLTHKLSKRLFLLCVLLTMLPDLDVMAFKFGISYESQWGHRGFTHSIIFSLVLGLLCVPFTKFLHSSRKVVFVTAFLSVFSHVCFDAFTNGGLGVAFYWPFSHERFFFPIHPVEVSPIGVKGFLSMRGVTVLISEILWIWLPCLFLSAVVRKIKPGKG